MKRIPFILIALLSFIPLVSLPLSTPLYGAELLSLNETKLSQPPTRNMGNYPEVTPFWGYGVSHVSPPDDLFLDPHVVHRLTISNFRTPGFYVFGSYGVPTDVKDSGYFLAWTNTTSDIETSFYSAQVGLGQEFNHHFFNLFPLVSDIEASYLTYRGATSSIKYHGWSFGYHVGTPLKVSKSFRLVPSLLFDFDYITSGSVGGEYSSLASSMTSFRIGGGIRGEFVWPRTSATKK